MGMESKTAMEPKTGMESKTIWLNGEFVDYEKATLHFMTPGLHYGIGVFEGIRCYQTDRGPAIFRLDEHIARFFHSALCLGFRSFRSVRNRSPMPARSSLPATRLTTAISGRSSI